MAVFRIRIAGAVFEVHSLFDSTKDYCRDYLTEENPDHHIEVVREDLVFEQAMLDEEAREEGMKRRKFTDPFLERTSIQRKAAEFLFDRNVLLVHGSAVAVDGNGYLFTAKCGTGKSTHTRLWREVFGSRAVMVNDDKPFLHLSESGVTICGAPRSGKHGLHTNVAVPLKGICILHRGPENRIERIGPEEAMPMLLHQSQPPLRSEKAEAFAQLVTHLADTIPLWRMECTKDPRAALVAWETMSKG